MHILKSKNLLDESHLLHNSFSDSLQICFIYYNHNFVDLTHTNCQFIPKINHREIVNYTTWDRKWVNMIYYFIKCMYQQRYDLVWDDCTVMAYKMNATCVGTILDILNSS